MGKARWFGQAQHFRRFGAGIIDANENKDKVNRMKISAPKHTLLGAMLAGHRAAQKMMKKPRPSKQSH